MVAPTGWHGRGFAMGERQDLLLQGRKLLEVQRPVSMALFSPNSDFMILSKSKFFRRFTIDSGDPPFPRDAQDWLFGCYESNEVQVRERQQWHFWISWFCFVCNWECFQKRVITPKSTLVVKSCPGGWVRGAACHWENRLLLQPFLGDDQFFPDFHDISLRMRTTKMILEWAMRCWTLFRLMRGGTFSNGETTQKFPSLGYLDTETLKGWLNY